MSGHRVERRYCEIRHDGGSDSRVITGRVIRYGDIADLGVFREIVEHGAFRWDDVTLNVQHDRGRLIARTGAGLTLERRDADVMMRAELPPTRTGDDALEAVRAGLLTGLSVEMVVKRETWGAGASDDRPVRHVTAAMVHGIGLVDRPAYPQSAVAREALEAVLVRHIHHRPRWR